MDWFATRILMWATKNGRKNFPWQRDLTPYRVWIAETMLQQTQATTVIKYFDQFLERFPTIRQLASASENEVLHAWTGLGYYRRAIRLREAANVIVRQYAGELPTTVEELSSLPGIGRSTAGAILSSAFNIPAPILDANVRRILSRFHAVNGPSNTKIPDSGLWKLALQHTPTKRVGEYTQAIMDFGVRQCERRNPDCAICPLQTRCKALNSGGVNSYPAPKLKSKQIDIVKRQLVILDKEEACLLEQLDDSGTYAKLWEPPTLAKDMDPAHLLQVLNLPSKNVSYRELDTLSPYVISNQRITESITVAKYRLQYSEIGTPDGTRWYRDDFQTPLGLSVKTRMRIDLAKTSMREQ